MSQKLHILAILIGLSPGTALGQDAPLPETVRFFADCSGHVAAHLAVQSGGGSYAASPLATPDTLDSIATILDTITTPDQRAAIQVRQREVRQAHVALLAHAMQYGDLTASDRAAAEVVRCASAVVERRSRI